MNRFLVFAGTTEGRLCAEYLLQREVEVHVCVASAYGGDLMKPHPFLYVHEGRKDCDEMMQLMEEYSFQEVIDATHPYAVDVSQNVKKACTKVGLSYIRLKRETKSDADSLYVSSMEEACSYLSTTDGNIFVTTGSKELAKLASLPNFKQRVYARVLSTPEVVEQCHILGLEGRHLMCMQGPFDTEMNIAMLKHVKASYMLTKEAGETGGFDQKMEAARRSGVTSIVISKPKDDQGYNMYEVYHKLYESYYLPIKREITFVGIGVGDLNYLTIAAKASIENADLIIGAKRMIESVSKHTKHVLISYQPDEIQAYIKEHPEYERIVFLVSGDVGFYSATKRYQQLFEQDTIHQIPGISSLVYFCSKLHMSWEDVSILSMHGRKGNLITQVKEHDKVFVLLGNTFTANDLCEVLIQYGFAQVDLWIGENLSYENERIQKGTPLSLAMNSYDTLCVAMISHTHSIVHKITGWPDEVFERSKVPMTKSEVRSICLSKLRLTKDAIVYDIGAGSGSVAVEMASVASCGEVYAIEYKQEAIQLIEQNRMKFKMEHMHVIEGMAPQAFGDLPAPTHAFIGGSKGSMKEIITTLLQKSPQCRIVISAIALETISEVMQILPQIKICDVDIVQVNIARSKTLASYHMMMGLNPVCIFSFCGATYENA